MVYCGGRRGKYRSAAIAFTVLALLHTTQIVNDQVDQQRCKTGMKNIAAADTRGFERYE